MIHDLRMAVASDGTWLRGSLTACFEREGFAVQEARGPEEVLQLVREWSPEIVLLCVRDGKGASGELLERLRAVTSAPIIVLLANRRSDAVVGVFRAGADDCLTEPFEMSELLARVGARLRRPARSA
jgi:two-component system, OmpR family, KDP operon response regulator KdpE